MDKKNRNIFKRLSQTSRVLEIIRVQVEILNLIINSKFIMSRQKLRKSKSFKINLFKVIKSDYINMGAQMKSIKIQKLLIQSFLVHMITIQSIKI